MDSDPEEPSPEALARYLQIRRNTVIPGDPSNKHPNALRTKLPPPPHLTGVGLGGGGEGDAHLGAGMLGLPPFGGGATAAFNMNVPQNLPLLNAMASQAEQQLTYKVSVKNWC